MKGRIVRTEAYSKLTENLRTLPYCATNNEYMTDFVAFSWVSLTFSVDPVHVADDLTGPTITQIDSVFRMFHRFD